VWDCGCGSGQASIALAKHFDQFVATDASAAQLQQAQPHARVTYAEAAAQASGLEPKSVDGVLVAMAVHWFAGDAFNAEVRRVARAGAVMAWIGYRPFQLPLPALQTLIDHVYGSDTSTARSWHRGGRRSGAGWIRAMRVCHFPARNGPSLLTSGSNGSGPSTISWVI